eukprot:1301913-Rhodomonas_salina.1
MRNQSQENASTTQRALIVKLCGIDFGASRGSDPFVRVNECICELSQRTTPQIYLIRGVYSLVRIHILVMKLSRSNAFQISFVVFYRTHWQRRRAVRFATKHKGCKNTCDGSDVPVKMYQACSDGIPKWYYNVLPMYGGRREEWGACSDDDGVYCVMNPVWRDQGAREGEILKNQTLIKTRCTGRIGRGILNRAAICGEEQTHGVHRKAIFETH